MQRDHDYDAVVLETLGHAAAATTLIAQSLKFDGAITLQLQGTASRLQMLVMQCTNELHLRGMAVTTAGEATGDDFSSLVGKANCAITVDSGDQPYQGIVAIEGLSLADSLEHYFERSVQVPSHLVLIANEQHAGGILLQQMPGQAIDADDWHRLGLMINTLSAGELASDEGIELLRKLFAEDDVRVRQPNPVAFRCRCTDKKVADVLRMLGEAETRAVLDEQGKIEVVCEYCGAKRDFDAVDVTQLFAANSVSGPDSLN